MASCPLKLSIIAVLCIQVLLSSCDKADTKKSGVSSAPPETAQNTPTSNMPIDIKSAPGGLPARAEKPPRIVKLKLLPASPRKGDTLIVQAQAVVAGNSEATVDFVYQWSVNGSLLNFETGPTLKNLFVKGDRISVSITPKDGGVSGIPLTQTAKIGNSPPVVKSELADVTVKGNGYSCKVQAEDPDGDALVYSLLKGPKNMTIEPSTGVIAGEYQEDDAGMHTLSISVKDSDNAEVVLDIPLQLGSSK